MEKIFKIFFFKDDFKVNYRLVAKSKEFLETNYFIKFPLKSVNMATKS